jgi:hypothetical protein
MPTKFMTFTGYASWAEESDAHPEHPIVIPPPDLGDAHPEHPIVIPDPPKPPQEGGGVPTHPIYFPPVPTHPIVIPPEGGKPPDEKPPTIWGGSEEPFPTPPIYLPDPPAPEDKFRWVWTPMYGWVILPPANVARPKAKK